MIVHGFENHSSNLGVTRRNQISYLCWFEYSSVRAWTRVRKPALTRTGSALTICIWKNDADTYNQPKNVQMSFQFSRTWDLPADAHHSKKKQRDVQRCPKRIKEIEQDKRKRNPKMPREAARPREAEIWQEIEMPKHATTGSVVVASPLVALMQNQIENRVRQCPQRFLAAV